MKKILLSLTLLFLSTNANAYIVSQDAPHGCNGNNNNGCTTAAVNTSSATLLVCGVSQRNNNPITGISDSLGNTWNYLNTITAAQGGVAIVYAYSKGAAGLATGSDTFTLAGSAAQYPSIVCAAYRNTLTYPNNPFDQQNGAGGASPGSITPTKNNELVIATATMFQQFVTPTVTSPYTVTGSVTEFNGVDDGTILASYSPITAVAVPNPAFAIVGLISTSAIASFESNGNSSVYLRRLQWNNAKIY